MDLELYTDMLRRIAQRLRIVLPSVVSGIDVFLPFLEKMRKEGAVVLLKFDGERGEGDNGSYTAVVSGQELKEQFFRIDASSIGEALLYIIVNYAQDMWDFGEGM